MVMMLVVVRIILAFFLLDTSACHFLEETAKNDDPDSLTKLYKERPDFLSHVSFHSVQQAISQSQEFHDLGIEHALANYNTDACKEDLVDTANVEEIALREYSITAPGSLVDLGEELPRKLYTATILTPQECQHVVELAEARFQARNRTTTDNSGPYPLTGLTVHQVPSLLDWFLPISRTRLFPLLARAFPEFVGSPDNLVVDRAYIFRYTADRPRTAIHTDSGVLSVTMALNPSSEYSGGGTWYEGLEEGGGVLNLEVGQATVRPGGLKHAGHSVRSGTRYVLGVFCLHRHKVEPVRQLLQHVDHTNQKEAREALEAALILNPHCDVTYDHLANHYLMTGLAAEAQHLLEYCLAHVHPSSSEIAYSLASLYMEQNLYDKAMDCLKICLDVDPLDTEANLLLAKVAVALDNTELEQECYHRIVQTPGVAASVVADAYGALGILHQGKADEISFYLESLKRVPDSFTFRYNLASAFADRQEWESAATYFREATRLANLEEEGGNVEKALHGLYRTAAALVRAEGVGQHDIIKRFQQVMGTENYARFASL